MKELLIVIGLFCTYTYDAFSQRALCLTDSCCRKILFGYYVNSKDGKTNSFADPVAPILIVRDKEGILLKYVEHTLKGKVPGTTKTIKSVDVNLYYSLQKTMRINSGGMVKLVAGHDTLFHSYTCRYGMGNDSAVTIMGNDRLHTYRPGDLLLYDRPDGKVVERIRETGYILKGSIECSVYTRSDDSKMETTEYKLVRYKGKYYWAKSTWMKTVFIKPGKQKWTQEQYMISWLVES